MQQYVLKIFYASLGADFLRIAGTTTEIEMFKSTYANIISRLMKQGGTISRIKKCLRKIYGRSFELFRSFSTKCVNITNIKNRCLLTSLLAINFFYKLQCVISA